jgi:broad specificity phosphatase PhoE
MNLYNPPNVVWLRHADKKYANRKGPNGVKQHDSPIKEGLTEDIDFLTSNLIKKHGIPDYILCSPFLRTRQTAEKILNYIEKNCKRYKIDIVYDNNISEFLGFQHPIGEEADVEEETKLLYKPNKILLGESIDELKLRTKKHILGINESYTGNVWVITHGIVIKYISGHLREIYGKTYPRDLRIDNLEYIEYNFQ